jgi:hypothetical protein
MTHEHCSGSTKHAHRSKNGPLLSRIALPSGSHGDDLFSEPQRVDQTLVSWQPRGREEIACREVDVLVVDDDTDPRVHQASKKKSPPVPENGGEQGFKSISC